MKIPTPTRAQRNYAYTVLGAVALLLVGFGLITGDEVQLYLNLAAALLGITGNVIAKGMLTGTYERA